MGEIESIWKGYIHDFFRYCSLFRSGVENIIQKLKQYYVEYIYYLQKIVTYDIYIFVNIQLVWTQRI